MIFGMGHKAHCMKPTRLERAINGGELGAIGMRFIELRFTLCCVIWSRQKKKLLVDSLYPMDKPRVRENIIIHARLTSDRIQVDPRIKKYIYIRLPRVVE